MNRHSRRSGISAFAGIAAAALLVLSCKSGPTDWESADEAVIEKNLAALESAGEIYADELESGGIGAAARKAQAALLASPGVDTAGIAADSSVWALFDNGILAGTGARTGGVAESAARRLPTVDEIRAGVNRELGQQLAVVTPFTGELPNTRDAGLWMAGLFRDLMWWPSARTLADAGVTRDAVRDLFASGPGFLYWAGHGTLVRVPGYGDSVSGLELGTLYDTRAMAQAAAGPLLDDLLPAGRDKRCAIWMHWLDETHWKYAVVVLPAFVREYADFPESGGKSLVYLSCCMSAYGRPGELVQAFLDRGADVVCGYDWATYDDWSAGRDAAFLVEMADTCLPFEAWRERSNADPTPWPSTGSRHANLWVYGDSLVRLQNVARVAKDGQWYRAVVADGEHTVMSALVGALRRQTDPEHSEQAVSAALEVWYPLNRTGVYSTATDPVATVFWLDVLSGRTYWAKKGYVGVGCQINITKSTPDLMHGTFSGTVGYWEYTQNPESVPPIQTLRLTDGCFKVTVIDSTQSPGGRHDRDIARRGWE